MIADLMRVETADGLKLDGALFAPTRPPGTPKQFDAVLLVHGTGGNFYATGLFGALIPRLANEGLWVASANTRGRDLAYAAAVGDRRCWLGSAFEQVSDCVADLAPWIAYLRSKELSRVLLLGHSLGGVKALYHQAHASADLADATVAVSPPCLSYSLFRRGPKREVFERELSAARALVDADQGEALMDVTVPLPYLVCARAYVDKYGADETYNILKWVEQVRGPVLATFGSSELSGIAFAGLPESLADRSSRHGPVATDIVAGADHLYRGLESSLVDHILRWCSGLRA